MILQLEVLFVFSLYDKIYVQFDLWIIVDQFFHHKKITDFEQRSCSCNIQKAPNLILFAYHNKLHINYSHFYKKEEKKSNILANYRSIQVNNTFVGIILTSKYKQRQSS